MRRLRVLVSGRVQGVFFRDSTRRAAESLGLCGWVRNLPDGRVEAVFEGDAEAVERALVWIREGPPLARVSRVEEIAEEPCREPPGFRIR